MPSSSPTAGFAPGFARRPGGAPGRWLAQALACRPGSLAAAAGRLVLGLGLALALALGCGLGLPAAAAAAPLELAAAAASAGPAAGPAAGAALFDLHCSGCHPQGGNIIRRGRTLRLDALERRGLASPEAIAAVAASGIGQMGGYGEALGPGGSEQVGAWVWEQAQAGWPRR